MFEWLWLCMVLSFQVCVGTILWMVIIVTAAGIIDFVLGTLKDIFSIPSISQSTGGPFKKREDPEEWFKDQMKDKHKWGEDE